MRVGVNICFDIVDDQILTESVEQGAQVIFAQSNNADFGTHRRERAAARHRADPRDGARSQVVNISTVGISAMIAPDGTITDRLPWYEPGSIVTDVPLSTVTTPAVLIGRQVEWLVSALGLAGVVIGAIFGRPERRRRA